MCQRVVCGRVVLLRLLHVRIGCERRLTVMNCLLCTLARAAGSLCSGTLSVRPSVCLSQLLTAAAACAGLLLGVRRSAARRRSSTGDRAVSRLKPRRRRLDTESFQRQCVVEQYGHSDVIATDNRLNNGGKLSTVQTLVSDTVTAVGLTCFDTLRL